MPDTTTPPRQATELEVIARLRRTNRMEASLRRLVYEATSLSPCEDDGSHWCRISADALAMARKAIDDG